jgi:UDP-N-acetylmuramyl tripeptide synthase
LNDNGADGRDISWIWDADFESLKEMNVNHFYCSGLRAEELALRLKYAGIEEGKISIDKDIKDVLKKSIEKTENLFVIPNYTLLETTRKEILKLQNEYNRKEASK